MARDQFFDWAQAQERRHEFDGFQSAGLTAFSRAEGTADWTATALTADDSLDMPELGVAVPVHELYEGVDLSSMPPTAEAQSLS